MRCWLDARLQPISTCVRGPQTVGPATFTRWTGFYAGGQFGYSSGNVDFSKATQPLIADQRAKYRRS